MALQDKLKTKAARAIELGAALSTIAVGIAVLTMIVVRYVWSSELPDRAREGAAIVGQEIGVGRHLKGSPDAKVVIVEFSDFECRFCRVYARDQYHVVMKELVASGQAAYAFRHFPLDVIHPRAFAGSLAAECAGEQGKFWEMHDVLFRGTLGDDQIRAHVAALGLDGTAFEACQARNNRDPVLQDMEDAKRAGVNGTPTFFVGVAGPQGTVRVTQVLHGAQGLAALTAAVRAAAPAS
jgi:protein-disulfide isomerase